MISVESSDLLSKIPPLIVVSVYVILQLKTEDKIDNKEEQMELEIDPDEEEKDDINIDDERERHCPRVMS